MRAIVTLLAIAFINFCIVQAQDFWERVPGPSATYYVSCLEEDVAGGRLYAGTPNGGGLFVSTNQGESWSLKSAGLPANSTVSDIAALGGGNILTICGTLHRSTNNGDTWEAVVGSPANLTNFHVTNAGVLFAGSEVTAGGTGIYRSTNGGVTWEQTRTGLPTYVIGPVTYVRSVSSISSDAGGVLYASVNSGSATTEVGVYKSVDNGGSWTRMSAGLLANVNVKPVFVSSDGTVYVGVRNRVYKSTDGAGSWTQTDSIPMASSQTVRHISRNSSGEILASTTSGTYRASAGGTGWTSVTNPYSSAQDFLIAGNGSYFSAGLDLWGTSGGVQKSTDAGTTWLPANAGINNTLTLALTVTPTGGIFNGLGGGRVDYSHDNGATFTRAFLPYTGQFAFAGLAAICGKAPGFIVAGTGEGLHASSDNGASWTKTSTAATKTIRLDLAGNFVAGGGGGVRRSTDNGQTWTSLNGGGDVYSLLVTNAGTILAGTYNSGINRTTNSGGNWTNSGTSLFGNITIGRFVQLTNGNIYVHTLGGIFRSADDGANWASVTGSPVGVQYRTLAATGNVLLLGTPSGLYKTTNEGGTWTTHASGLMNTILDHLALAPDGKLYGGGGAGIYRTVSPILTGVQQISSRIPGQFSLGQNYPNPFNPVTTISYQLSAASHVTIKVYDVTGREVATLVAGEMHPGTYEVRFDAAGLASGTYFYRLTAGAFTATRRMILSR